jgi:hypothetical protein
MLDFNWVSSLVAHSRLAHMQLILRYARMYALTLSILLVAFAVFNWGLQYKMSLYQTSTNGTQAPAKLLTGGKITSAAITPALRDQAAPVLFLAALLVLLRWVNCRPLVRITSNFLISRKPRIRIALTTFSFRPPPAAA